MSSNASKKMKPDLSLLSISKEDRKEKQIDKSALTAIACGAALFFFVVLYFVFSEAAVDVNVAYAKSMGAQQNITTLNASGYITPQRKATIATEVSARIVSLNFDEGMLIEKGDVLAELDAEEIEVGVKAAAAELQVTEKFIIELDVTLANAKRRLKRNQDVYEKTKAVSQQDLDDSQLIVDALGAKKELAQAHVIAAQAQLEAMQKDLENYTIRAPFTGVIVSKDANIGEMVSPFASGDGYTRTGVATIVDMDSLEIEVDVNELSIAKASVGQDVVANLDAYPNWDIPATVKAIIPTADRKTATIKVRISINELDPKMLPDMGVKVSFLYRADQESNAQAVVNIPRDAVQSSDGKKLVYVIIDDAVEYRAIKTGDVNGELIEVLAGLREGEKVVVGNASALEEGQEVNIVE